MTDWHNAGRARAARSRAAERNAAAARIDAARSVFLAAFRAELPHISALKPHVRSR